MRIEKPRLDQEPLNLLFDLENLIAEVLGFVRCDATRQESVQASI